MREAATEVTAPAPSDAVLISRIRAGDPSAYGMLYERHLDAARGLARHLIGGDAADDAVQDTFTKVLDVLRRGGGPQSGFRPYLLTAVRRTVYDRYRSEKRLHSTDEIELFDPGQPFEDPALAGLERSMIVRAYQSLPERWRAVLWHTVVEGAKPAEVAPLLGLTANGAAALAYRAREGLRQAYLQMHLAEPRPAAEHAQHDAAGVAAGAAVSAGADERCRPALDRLGAYVRGGLAKRESRLVEEHLDDCPRCKAIHAELADVNNTLRDALGPLVLGTAAAAYLAAVAKGGLIGGGIFGWFRHLPKRQQQALSGGVAATAALAVAGMLLVSNNTPIEPTTPAAKPPAVQPPAKPPKPKPAKPPAAQPPPPAPVPVPKPQRPVAAPKAKPNEQPPTPQPQVPPPPAKPSRLTASIGAVGTLLREQTGIVAMAVRNQGEGRSKDVIADVDLPPDVAYRGATTGRNGVAFLPARPPGDGWNCRPTTGTRVRCTHAPLPPGKATSAYLEVHVGGAAPFDTPPRVTLHGDGTPVTARARQGIARDGLPARYAVDGTVRTAQVGNALLGCPPAEAGCEQALDRKGERRDNDFWNMAPIDRDDDPETKSSSAALLDLPPGAKVLWAGLYWSGVGKDAGTIRLRGPKATAYSTIRPTETRNDRMPGFLAYQGFADVTAQVREAGGGTWWGADAPTRAGVGDYAGWSLVVVVEDAAAPYQQAMVLDGVRAVGPHTAAKDFSVQVNGLLASARPARIGLVSWEGDADLPGDRLLLNGTPLTPGTGDGAAGNVLDSSAFGAIGTKLTFGIDVDCFSATVTDRATLTLTTRQDAFLTGVVTVTAPMRS
ncbi:sigma-70 family RNA polymerase sigma factor [Actinomadura hibisca]|uniref:sigma-70 family RNA polymerase sigma factor n=1 Tax=Actinomadura hibisca TaxID=68565 RepID=UPI00082A37A8|nr:sigma-70 family RNA polymerase sigma factor [Actinomadura hibisca]